MNPRLTELSAKVTQLACDVDFDLQSQKVFFIEIVFWHV